MSDRGLVKVSGSSHATSCPFVLAKKNHLRNKILPQAVATVSTSPTLSVTLTIYSLASSMLRRGSQMIGEASDAPCAHCKALSPYHRKRTYGGYIIPYNRTDEYPDFLALEAIERRGCHFCGLLRHALQDKYSDKKIAEAESDFHPSIRAKWPLGWNGQVTVGDGGFLTEEDWASRDTSQTLDQSLGDIYALSFVLWPHPPRWNDCSAESNWSRI